MATTTDTANAINNALLSPLQDYEPISGFTEIVALEEDPVFLELPTHRVYNNLRHLNKFKAPGSDGLSNWVLKGYAVLLAQPVSDILNASYKEQKRLQFGSSPTLLLFQKSSKCQISRKNSTQFP